MGKKMAGDLHRTAQPPTLAAFRPWGSSTGAGRVRPADAKIIISPNPPKYLQGEFGERLLSFRPAHRITGIFDGQGLPCHHERMESIDHDGEFPGFLLPDALFYRSGVRSVWNTRGMQGDHPAGDMLAAHKVTIHVIQEFIAVDIAVIVRRRNALGMVVVHPGDEGADHKIVRFKGLMNGRRLVDPTRDGFEIMNAESEGIAASVPSDDIEGMMGVVQSVEHPLFLCFYQKVSCLIDRIEAMRWPDVALTIGGVFEQLPVFTVIAFWIAHRTKGLNDEQPVVGAGELDPVDGPPWNDQIITIAEGKFAIHRMQNARTFMYEDDLICVGILEKIVLHAVAWGRQYDMAVVVHKYRHAGCQVIGCRCDMESLKTTMFEHALFGDLGGYADGLIGGYDAGWRMAVVEQ
jgi:hypothetical protein